MLGWKASHTAKNNTQKEGEMKVGDRVRFWVNTYEPEFGTIMNIERKHDDCYAEIEPDTRSSSVYLFRHGSAWRFEPL